MKNLLIILAIIVQTSIVCFGQESGKPLSAATNVAGAEFPKILPDLSVQFRTIAPDAQKVQIDLGKKYDMIRSDDGSWTVTSDPQVPGFHYYSLVIDGISVADPASEAFYGMGRMASAIEIPEKGVGFYEIKDVPHGTISSKYYFSKLTNSWRHLFVYTPPGYEANSGAKYPVVYIQHGGGEDERGWAQQGKTDIIVDNLIAEGKARPMIVVMANGNVHAGTGGYSSEAMAAFKNEMTQNIVPFIDKNFRTIANAKNRAICGLSMGGGQSFYVGLQSLDCFGSVGIFSSGIFGGIRNPSGNTFDAEKEIPGLLTKSGEFNKNLDLFYISCGEQDPRIEFTKKAVSTMKESGLEVQFNSFPGNHEWQVWRKSLNDFASRVFK
jgi:enterochelin esterase family protein